MSQIKRICFYGGPGCGKSTIATGVFHELKKLGYNAEYVPEYIKNWAYEGRMPKSFQQVYVFAKQLNREDVLFPHVDLVVTDSPILMNVVYSKKYGFEGSHLLADLAMLYEKQFPSLHIFLDRGNLEYKTEGRYQDESGARELDALIEEILQSYAPSYKKVPSQDFSEIMRVVTSSLTV